MSLPRVHASWSPRQSLSFKPSLVNAPLFSEGRDHSPGSPLSLCSSGWPTCTEGVRLSDHLNCFQYRLFFSQNYHRAPIIEVIFTNFLKIQNPQYLLLQISDNSSLSLCDGTWSLALSIHKILLEDQSCFWWGCDWVNNNSWNENIFISIGTTENATWKNNFTEYASVSSLDDPLGMGGGDLCNGCEILWVLFI